MKSNELTSVVSRRLRELLGANSANSFALRCGISTSQFTRWLKGESLPAADGLARIVRTTGVSSDWILGVTESRAGMGGVSASSVGGPAAASGSGNVNVAALQTSQKALEDLAAANRALTETNALLARSLASNVDPRR